MKYTATSARPPDLFFTRGDPDPHEQPVQLLKASADLPFVLAYHRTYGLPVTISRCSNNYGPYHFPEKLDPADDRTTR
ncbi:MAG: NAD-dependent epimerase/dehydratase family protein [Lachnospiraceae bacterium]